MNIVGLLIGVVFWLLVLWLIPGLPIWVRLPIRVITLVLLILTIARVVNWVRAKKQGVEP